MKARAAWTAVAAWLAAGMLGACSPAHPAEAGSGGGDGPDGGSDAAVAPMADAAPSGGDAEAPAGPPSARTPPASGTLLGAFVGVENNDEQAFLDEEKLLGRRWVIDNRFYSYEDWINDRTRWDIAQHKIPLVTWEPHEPLDEIIAGQHDDVIHMRARGARDLGVEMYLRWGHEMNGNWYPWAGANNGNEAGPAKYIAAYRHVHDLFVADGATNVVWVWCPLVADVPADSWNHWSNYYPGDDYVDWIGLDAYNWGNSSSCCTWQSFGDLIADFYADYAGKKPLIVAEMSSAEVGGDKAAWIDDVHQQLKTRFSAIRAVVWFDINKETDWRIDSSARTLAAYQAMAFDPFFNP